jgi:hypothetical protein
MQIGKGAYVLEWKFLINCADDFEAGLIMGVLDDKGIPNVKKYRGAGDYMRVIGGVGKDVDIYVPAERFADAEHELQTFSEQESVEEE